MTVATGVTEPVSIYTSGSNNTITDDGSGGGVIDSGTGQSIVHSGYGFNSPEIVADSDSQTAASGASAYFGKTGSWTQVFPTTAYNQEEQSLAANATGIATWTFTDLPVGYFDVYVTWSPQPGAATAQYVVNTGSNTDISVNQSIGPNDYQSAGVFWQHLGVFQVTSGTLTVQLSSSTNGLVIANAVQLVSEGTTAPATNLTVGGIFHQREGQISVPYTITGSECCTVHHRHLFLTGRHNARHIAANHRRERSHATGRRQPYTATADAALSGLTEDDYLLAELDINNNVYEQSRANNISAPWSGMFEQDDGTVYVFGGSGVPRLPTTMWPSPKTPAAISP